MHVMVRIRVISMGSYRKFKCKITKSAARRVGRGIKEGIIMHRTEKKMTMKEGPRRRRTIFHLNAPDAGEVYLAGDFNHWDLRKHPMEKQESGVWKKTTMLFPGRYEYKFLVDGRWQIDSTNDQMCWNRFGTQNNFVEIKPG